MPRLGDSFETELREAHLEWGTTAREGTRNRNPLESYIPISAPNARRLNIKRGQEYSVLGADFTVYAGGSQCEDHAKNLESRGDLTLLGAFLRDTLHVQLGDTVRVEWVTNSEVSITRVP